jgi:hypothetical protein
MVTGMMLGAVALFGCAGTSNAVREAPQVLYESLQPEHGQFTSLEIPLRIVDGMPSLRLETQRKALDIFLDSGANQTTLALAPQIVKNLDVQYVKGATLSTSNYKITRGKPFLLSEAKLGGELFYRNLLCSQRTIEKQSPARNSGLLGIELLKEFNVLLDYNASKMALYPHDGYPEDDGFASWHNVTFIDHGYGVLVTGTFTGSSQELTFLLDTGAVARDDKNTSFNLMKGAALAKVEHLSGEQFGGYPIIRSQDLVIGDIPLHSLNFVFVDAFTQPPLVDGFLGNDFLLKYKVFLDFGASTMYLQRQE